jgi:serine/threonine protein kinase
MAPNIRVRFFKPDEEAVFKKCLGNIPGANRVIVQPLERFGYSGARVFVFYPDGEHSLPYVGKIHSKRGIKEEKEGRDHAKKYFREAREDTYVATNGTRAILATSLIGRTSRHGVKVRELKDILYTANETRILRIINKVYSDNCGASFQGCEIIEKRLGDEYERYLRKRREPEKLLRTWLGRFADSQTIQIYDREVPNPLICIERLCDVQRKIPVTIVHGDLHPSNVVLDSNGIPRLLDFSWCARQAHVLKDILIMECSVRFLMMPRHLGIRAQAILDECLLDPNNDTVKQMLMELKGDGIDDFTYRHVERCSKVVMCLRQHAANVCPGESTDDYLACQSLVLYGLMGIEHYPFGPCARALGLIAERLHARDYFANK